MKVAAAGNEDNLPSFQIKPKTLFNKICSLGNCSFILCKSYFQTFIVEVAGECSVNFINLNVGDFAIKNEQSDIRYKWKSKNDLVHTRWVIIIVKEVER